MTKRLTRESSGTLYFFTKKGKLQECNLGSNKGCTVPFEAGEFFYNLRAVFARVKCHACDTPQIAYFEKATCTTFDELLSEYEDHMDFATEFECTECGAELKLNLFATWYNNNVNFFKHDTKNCSLIRMSDTDSIFNYVSRDDLDSIKPIQ